MSFSAIRENKILAKISELTEWLFQLSAVPWSSSLPATTLTAPGYWVIHISEMICISLILDGRQSFRMTWSTVRYVEKNV